MCKKGPEKDNTFLHWHYAGLMYEKSFCKKGIYSDVTFLHQMNWDFNYQYYCTKRGYLAMSPFYTLLTGTLASNVVVQKGAIVQCHHFTGNSLWHYFSMSLYKKGPYSNITFLHHNVIQFTMNLFKHKRVIRL